MPSFDRVWCKAVGHIGLALASHISSGAAINWSQAAHCGGRLAVGKEAPMVWPNERRGGSCSY